MGHAIDIANGQTTMSGGQLARVGKGMEADEMTMAWITIIRGLVAAGHNFARRRA